MTVPALGFLIPGPREILIMLVVGLALYGRTGTRLLMTTRYGRWLSPWIQAAETARGRAAGGATRPRRPTPDAPRAEPRPEPAASRPEPRPQGRLFWALTLVVAAAVASWVATRTIIQHSQPQATTTR